VDHDDNLIPFPRGRETDPAGPLDLAAGALRSGWLTQGVSAQRLGVAAATLLDGRPAVTVSGGSAAMHLALLSLELTADDEVVLPAVGTAALANLVILAGGRPVFADILAIDRPVLDADAVARHIGATTRAIVVEHHAGLPAPAAALRRLADDHGAMLIEDCRTALGTRASGRLAGTWGDVAVFALGPRPDGGGVLSCVDDDWRRMVETLRTAVGSPGDECFVHSCEATLTAGYGIDEAAAAHGVAALEALGGELSERVALAGLAAERLERTGRMPLLPMVTPADRASARVLPVVCRNADDAGALAADALGAGVGADRPAATHHCPPHNARLPRPHLPVTEEYCERVVELEVAASLGRLDGAHA
jgi:perosamine synthetase